MGDLLTMSLIAQAYYSLTVLAQQVMESSPSIRFFPLLSFEPTDLDLLLMCVFGS